MKNILIDGRAYSLIDEIISKNESMLINDPNLNYYNYYALSLKEKGYKTYLINIDEPKYSDGFNPFILPYKYYKKDKDKAIYEVKKITDMLLLKVKNDDTYWNTSASLLLTSIIIRLFEEAKEEEINFRSIYEALNLISLNDKHLIGYLKESDTAKRIGATVFNLPKDTMNSILSVCFNAISYYNNYDSLVKMLSYTSFETIDKTVIFMKSSYDTKKNSILNILINQIYEVTKNKNYNIILDNFDVLSYNDYFTDMFNSSLDFDIRFILKVKNLDRIKDLYDYEVVQGKDIKVINKCELPKQKDIEIKTFDYNSKIEKRIKKAEEELSEKIRLKKMGESIEDVLKETFYKEG